MKNQIYTTNGALQYKDSGEKCLDLFSKIGSIRHFSRPDILEMFEVAFKDNSELATRVAFWARAAREGAGERKTFYIIMDEIARISPEFISDNARTLAELGYWKDLLRYIDIPGVVSVFAQAIKDGDRLACKWAPRKCSVLRDKLGMTNKQYRKWLKKHSNTVEQQMSHSKWSDIQYSSVPGSAMRKYSRAFDKNDSSRFESWKNDKTSKASVSATYPHDIWDIRDESLQDKLWNNLPDLLVDSKERILPMIDVSGSMFGKPIAVAISLGMYLAERNNSDLKDLFLTFSESPELVKIKGDTLRERMTSIHCSDWGMNTDFEKAYRRILEIARENDVTKDSMPTMLLVLSDMQFDESQNNSDGRWTTHLSWIKDEYEQSGYDFPKLVFWNLDAHVGTPAQCSDENVAMVSGFSPNIMKAILNAEDFNPMDVMMEALNPIELDYTNLKSKLDIDYNREK